MSASKKPTPPESKATANPSINPLLEAKQKAKLDPATEELWRIARVCGRVGVSKTTWYSWVQQGIAPAGVKLSPGITVWPKSVIDDFIARLIEQGAA
ncbi:helix-turn-helix transcriptional regulator [Gilvimarinus polysaccharolyticus]|uniref:helix-turn-helix transcriptional regulator n=1 Tax=Gilvimarinus polysaccharolyticus TaxID=863921 RepID=UPI000673137B|nr:AlpA family phage regulatory protein [Gilvimarinus polysaccharolyticus]